MMRLIDHLGNGWAIMGAAEALTALEQFPKLRNSPRYMELLQNFQFHAGNLSLLQNKQDGKWHNVLDHPETFTETSATAMILTAMLRGLQYGWLDQAYLPIIEKGWRCFARKFNAHQSDKNWNFSILQFKRNTYSLYNESQVLISHCNSGNFFEFLGVC